MNTPTTTPAECKCGQIFTTDTPYCIPCCAEEFGWATLTAQNESPASKRTDITRKMNTAVSHPFFTMQTESKLDTTKTYGRGKLRINLNSPRGNIYAIWAVARNLMIQSNYTPKKISETLASLKKDTYEECLEAFGKHKLFGSLFKLYSSPEYIFHYDEDEWGNPDEEDDACEECGDEIDDPDDEEDDEEVDEKRCSACRYH